ncbi:hypothetical protein Q3G72_034366 [Acer saccharum]|nr:hypothetical protein Q3G72_034366 [Acer saccharum]
MDIIEKSGYFVMEFQNTCRALSPSQQSTAAAPMEWTAPPSGCLKLNTDVSVKSGKNFIGIGAAIRDSSGIVVAAISKPLVGRPSVELGELLELHEGLLLAKRYNLAVQFAEVDALSVASMINSNSSAMGDAMFLISDIKSLCIKLGGCVCQHIPRLSNVLAHRLANLAFALGDEVVWRDVNPVCIFPLL